jgi:hypothetical protein
MYRIIIRIFGVSLYTLKELNELWGRVSLSLAMSTCMN